MFHTGLDLRLQDQRVANSNDLSASSFQAHGLKRGPALVPDKSLRVNHH